MKLEKMPAIRKGVVNVIVETPKGSQNKFAYDPKLDLFSLHKSLPMGAVFPFDFGFIPNTKGEDGDPLDVLVIMDQPAYPGCHIPCRVIGVLRATQREKNKKEERNDRFVAVADSSVMYSSIRHIKELNKSMVDEIESFFEDYNKQEGKKFMPGGWKGGEEALKIIKKAITSKPS